MKTHVFAAAFALPGLSWSATCNFTPPIDVYSAAKSVHLHLESAGRRSMAVNEEGTVAIVWEDDRGGKPRIQAAFKGGRDDKFKQLQTVTQGEAAYEAVIVPLEEFTFLVAWEQNQAIFARVVNEIGQGPIARLSEKPARQVSLSLAQDGQPIAVWSEKRQNHYQIVYRQLHIKTEENVDTRNLKINADPLKIVETKVDADQNYATIAVSRAGMTVAWEDRRSGSTRIHISHAPHGKAFAPSTTLNKFRPPPSAKFGKGTGAMRVVLTSDGEQRVAAVWLDKRDFEGGYDVYAAVSNNGGAKFGDNELVQDLFGNNTPQWHPTLALLEDGSLMAAWDDSRDASSDVWYSWREQGQWSDDKLLADHDPAGNQAQPILTADNEGRVHVVFIDQQESNNRLRYTMCTPTGE